MIATEITLLASSVLVAIPAIRAAGRVLLARLKYRTAAAHQAQLLDRDTASLTAQKRQTLRSKVARLHNEANDLIEYGALAPTWALCSAICGVVLNIATRTVQLLSP